MFDEKTVLILGAGASCAYGYPTGAELIKRIKETLSTQAIYRDYEKKSPQEIKSICIIKKY